jgi:hypothetical protein
MKALSRSLSSSLGAESRDSGPQKRRRIEGEAVTSTWKDYADHARQREMTLPGEESCVGFSCTCFLIGS